MLLMLMSGHRSVFETHICNAYLKFPQSTCKYLSPSMARIRLEKKQKQKQSTLSHVFCFRTSLCKPQQNLTPSSLKPFVSYVA
jgi:hypothetical protein